MAFDRNGDGISTANEMSSLADAGIASLNLAGSAVNRSWGWQDNVTVNTGAFTRSDGTAGVFSDVGLRYDRAESASPVNANAPAEQNQAVPNQTARNVAALAALRAGRRSGQLLASQQLAISGSDIFDRYETRPSASLQPEIGMPRTIAPTQIREIGEYANSSDIAINDNTQQLDLIRQHMAGFGVRTGENNSGISRNNTHSRFDYFA